jgi:alpha-glucosidase
MRAQACGGCVLAVALLLAGAARAEGRRLSSPDGAVQAVIGIDAQGRLAYEVAFRGAQVVAPSPIGLTLDGKDMGRVASLTAVNVRDVHERFPVRGAHAEAAYDALVALFTVTPLEGVPYGVQISVANGGFAWRFLVPGEGSRRVTGETARWRLPSESRVWFAERRSEWKLKTYAGEWLSAPLGELHRISPQGPVQTMPLVAELPGGRGYAAVTEAALYRYSGLRLEARPDGELRGVFTEKDGFSVSGRFRTPWRVLLLAPTLDALVNSDLVSGLNPPPDPALFEADGWTAGGRSVWSWWQGDPDFMTVESEKRVIDCATRLQFEFTTLDEGWEGWTNAWDTLKDVCGYAATNGVRVFVWKHAKELNVPADNYAALRAFLDRVKAAGAAGVKVDFMNGEDAGLVAFDEWVLQEAAARKLLVNFHGCQKPCGESRTYPNEVTREAVRGLELNRITEGYLKRQREKGADLSKRALVPGGENQDLPASHNAALPFTRGVVGHADYTPLAFSRPGETTWAHQLAMAYLVTSPLLVMAEHPQRLLGEPRLAAAIPFIQALPVAWDETRVLEGSRIGEVAALARRKGTAWYVAIVNGTPNLKLVSFAPLFTGWKNVRVSQLADVPGRAAEFAASERAASGDGALIVTLEPCGGYVARLTRE